MERHIKVDDVVIINLLETDELCEKVRFTSLQNLVLHLRDHHNLCLHFKIFCELGCGQDFVWWNNIVEHRKQCQRSVDAAVADEVEYLQYLSLLKTDTDAIIRNSLKRDGFESICA